MFLSNQAKGAGWSGVERWGASYGTWTSPARPKLPLQTLSGVGCWLLFFSLLCSLLFFIQNLTLQTRECRRRRSKSVCAVGQSNSAAVARRPEALSCS